ncbi:MAG TPA: flippase-like domain-containing protein [Methylomirabilota bacterium]|nr:flippase-like domain-containing protein [Methylomirabilota bacterium]
MSAARLVLALVGAVLMVGLVVQIGPAAVAASFTALSSRLLILVWFPFAVILACDTLGWNFAFRDAAPSFRSLLLTRLAGEAINASTPTASLGGEGVKAWLLRPQVSLQEGLASVIIAKTTITIAQALLLLVGIVVAWPVLPGSSALTRVMIWLLVLEVLAVGGFIAAQITGGATLLGRLLARVKLLHADTLTRHLAQTDRALRDFYQERPRRLALSILFHFLGWALGAVEVYLVLHWLGAPISPTTALVIEAFGTGVRFASFMVPAHLGALEGGYVMTFAALGLGSPLGLTFGLVRRVRELAWTALGFFVLVALGAPVVAPPLLPADRKG